jgi:hypothetical protein
MTIAASGALGLQDAGTNPSSNVLIDTVFGNFQMVADTSFGLHRPYRSYYDGEHNAYDYANDQVVDGTAYVYKKSSLSIYHDSGHSTGFLNYSGYDSFLGKGLIAHMNSQYASGQSYESSTLGLNCSGASTLGSLSIHTYTDVSGVSRTINSIGAIQNTHGDSGTGSSQNEGNMVWISMDGNVPNSANTFHQAVIYDSSGNGITLPRTGAEYIYDGTHSTWTWYNNSDAVISFVNWGTNGRLLMTRSGNTTFNNGIAEEMGGADSSNVTASHYYKGGTFHNTAGIPVTGNPLPFSDFYGKTKASLQLASGTFNVYYLNTYGVQFSGYSHGISGGDTINTFSFQGTNSRVSMFGNSSALTGIILTIKSLGGVDYWVNQNDWSTLKVYNAANGSGTPVITLFRTSASASVTNNGSSNVQIQYTWSGSYAFSTYFGTSGQRFLEIF